VIYLLRHGQTEHYVDGRIQGRCDSPLTELGQQQAGAMGARLRELLADDDGFEVVSSPLGRAVASAEIVREYAGLTRPLITDARLEEVGCGSWEKHHFASLAARDPRIGEAPNFLAAWALYCSDGERLDEATARLSGWLTSAEGRELVVIGHGVAGSLLRGLYSGMSQEDLLTMRSSAQGGFHRLHGGQVEEISCS
jgi:broad specificity phosphatase PhoE